MESVLIVVTLVSLAMTIVLGAILARLVRDERRRSEARVALLRDMADAASHQQEFGEPAPRDISHRDTVKRVDHRVETKVDMKVAPVKATSGSGGLVMSTERQNITADDLHLMMDDTAASPAGDLFVRPEARSAWPRRLAVAAAMTLIVAFGVTALRSRPHSSDAARPVETRTVPGHSAGLLELVSLQQTQAADALTITGLVQNPRDGAVLSKVRATALLFGPDGSFLASGGAPLDFTVLRPGDESPFVISVPVTAPVARYRVGFRSEDGHVIGHVDRRAAAAMASEAAPVRSRGSS